MEAHTWSEAHADLPGIAQANASTAVARQFLKEETSDMECANSRERAVRRK
jgi:hypothetical protein